MVIIRFKKIFIVRGLKKKRPVYNLLFFQSKEEIISDQALTSPFCHIEGTIGILNDLPLLIINEVGVREEGILKGGKFSSKTKPFNLSNIEDFFNDEIVKKQISVWIGKVTDYYLFKTQKSLTNSSIFFISSLSFCAPSLIVLIFL